VFEWILEVDEDALGEDRGRIQIIVEYQMNLVSSLPPSSSPRQQQRQQQRHRDQSGSRRGRRHRQRSTSSTVKDSASSGGSGVYRSVQNRITAHVDIQRDNTYAIVPVVKVCAPSSFSSSWFECTIHRFRCTLESEAKPSDSSPGANPTVHFLLTYRLAMLY